MSVIEARAELVAALKSGKYKKGKFRLRSKGDEFCCLGVAVDLNQDTHPWVDCPEELGVSGFADVRGGVQCACLDADLQAKYGFAQTWQLIEKNDTTDTFNEVIELIERMPVPA